MQVELVLQCFHPFRAAWRADSNSSDLRSGDQIVSASVSYLLTGVGPLQWRPFGHTAHGCFGTASRSQLRSSGLVTFPFSPRAQSSMAVTHGYTSSDAPYELVFVGAPARRRVFQVSDIIIAQLFKLSTPKAAPRQILCPDAYRIKFVQTGASCRGIGTPAAAPAAMHWSSHAILCPSTRMTRTPSSSCCTCSAHAP